VDWVCAIEGYGEEEVRCWVAGGGCCLIWSCGWFTDTTVLVDARSSDLMLISILATVIPSRFSYYHT
jgi:hypothetical protein